MNKKILGVFVTLVVVIMMALPIGVAYAEKPTIEMVLTGTFYTGDTNPEHWIESYPGHNIMYKARDFESIWYGEIEGSGVYLGNWLINPNGGQWVEEAKAGNFVFSGSFALENVLISDSDGTGFVGTGDIRIQPGLTVAGGSGDLKSIRGKGYSFPLDPDFHLWGYVFEVQINP